jgi:hypothetical protein
VRVRDVRVFLLSTSHGFTMDKVPRGRKSERADQEIRQKRWNEENQYAWRSFSRSMVAAHMERTEKSLSKELGDQANSGGDLFEEARRVCSRTLIDFLLGRSAELGEFTEAASKLAVTDVDLNERPEPRWRLASGKRSTELYAQGDRLHDSVSEIIAARKSGDAASGQPDALDTRAVRRCPVGAEARAATAGRS